MIRKTAAVALSVAALSLTSCGSAHPGAAAQVGDQSISMSTVDKATRDVCDAFAASLKSRGLAVPMAAVRFLAIDGLVTEAEANQIADQYAVQPGQDYSAAVAQENQQVASLPADIRDSVVRVLTASTLKGSVLAQAGQRALGATGSSDASQVTAKGNEIFTAWAASHTVQVDPRFGATVKDGAVQPGDLGVSLALSPGAQSLPAVLNTLNQPNGQLDDAAKSYIDSLPASQKCGA